MYVRNIRCKGNMGVANLKERLLLWYEGKALGYRFGGHAFKPFHRHIHCVLLVNQPI